MGIKTDAPHWSMWMIDRILPGLELPDDDVDPQAAWEGGWTLYEVDRTKTRSMMEGSLDISVVPAGKSAVMSVVQEVPMFWRMSVEATAELQCDNDAMLQPVSWTTTAVGHTNDGVTQETRSKAKGEIAGNAVRFSGVDESKVAVPKGQPLTTSWAILGMLPRLTAAGEERAEFTMLDELVAVRPGQQLQRFDPVEVPISTGTVSLTRWRHIGVGTPPVQYFVTERGWPMMVCGLRRALVIRYLNAGSGGGK